MKIADLKDKKTVILGLGREGIDTFLFLRKMFPEKTIGVADQQEIKNLKGKIKKAILKDKNIKKHFNRGYLRSLKKYDIIIKSPGVAPKIIKPYIGKKQTITSQTDIFFENCPGKIVGITGTKGKSTTATLIFAILRSGGLKAHLAGNIGKPVLSLLPSAKPEDVYVYELSSHQLFYMRKSPQIAVFLNVFPEHLDYYRNFREYARAKANITAFQEKKDFLVYNAADKTVKTFARKSKAQKIAVNAGRIKAVMKKAGETHLAGKFNFLNIAAAFETGKIFKIPEKRILKAIKAFKPLPYRLEYVGKFSGIKFYNDTLSTIPEAAISAIDALGSNVETIFLGGFDRNIDFKNLAKKILASRIKNLILFPKTGKKIWKEIDKSQKGRKPKAFMVNGMEEAVKAAYKFTGKGKIALLSPASASYNQFRDYREKGDLFKKYVKKYGRKKNPV